MNMYVCIYYIVRCAISNDFLVDDVGRLFGRASSSSLARTYGLAYCTVYKYIGAFKLLTCLHMYYYLCSASRAERIVIAYHTYAHRPMHIIHMFEPMVKCENAKTFR